MLGCDARGRCCSVVMLGFDVGMPGYDARTKMQVILAQSLHAVVT